MRLPFLLLIALALMVPGGCAQTGKPDPILSSAETPPTAPAVNCQPTVLARSEAAPQPPAGLTREGFYNPLQDFVFDRLGDVAGTAWWQWFTVTYPKWAREGWVRIDEARKLPPCAPG